MPLLAAAQRRVGRKLGSSARVSEAEQNQICAYLSIALLVGLSANALLGWWCAATGNGVQSNSRDDERRTPKHADAHRLAEPDGTDEDRLCWDHDLDQGDRRRP